LAAFKFAREKGEKNYNYGDKLREKPA